MHQVDREMVTGKERGVNLPVLGIDVGKANFHVALVVEQQPRPAARAFSNNDAGFNQLIRWLANRKVERVHACLEATGGFSEALGAFLHDRGNVVNIVNAARVKAFGRTELIRNKNDSVDAALIARFCALHRPEPWRPPSLRERKLRALVRHHASLVALAAEHKTRLQAPSIDEAVRQSVERVLGTTTEELRRIEAAIDALFDEDPDLRNRGNLLASIPGIGAITARRILTEMPHLEEFRNAKCVGAFAGLSPQQHLSGTLRGKTRISKIGSASLRQALYFPALAARRLNPTLKAFGDRLAAAGKPPMVVLVAIMRKLLVLAYGVLKSGRPYRVPVGT